MKITTVAAIISCLLVASAQSDARESKNQFSDFLQSTDPISPAVVFLPTCSDANGDVGVDMCETFNGQLRAKLERAGGAVEVRSHRQKWRAIEPDSSNLDLGRFRYILIFRGPLASKSTNTWVVESFAHVHLADAERTYVGEISSQKQSANFSKADIVALLSKWTTAYANAILDSKCPAKPSKEASLSGEGCNPETTMTVWPDKSNPFFKPKK